MRHKVSAQQQDIGSLAAQLINETREQLGMRDRSGVKVRSKGKHQWCGQASLFYREAYLMTGDSKLAV
jgi:hypothetical protein